MAMLCFFIIRFLKILLVCLFVCLTVVGITESTKSITVVSTASVSTISAIVSAKIVSVGVGMTVVSGVEDSGISLSLSLGVSLTLLAGISHSGFLCGSRGGNKERMMESISVAISVSVGSGIGNRGCPSSDGTRNNFGSFMFNSMKMWGSGGQKIFTTSKRNWGWDNCSGCSVFDSNDSWVSLTLLTAPQAIAKSIASNMDYCRFPGHSSDGTGNMFCCFMFNGITDSGCVVKTITITEGITIRVNKGGNCGCRVGGCKDGRVSLTLLATIVSVSITVSSAVVSSVVSTIVSSVS